MNGFFSLDNPIWNALGKLWDLIWLSILWFICCIPIFTIGASTTAVYYVCLKMARNEEGYVTRQFFHSFKENFKQGTVVWLIVLAVGAVLGFNLYFYQNMNDGTMIPKDVANVMFIIMLVFLWAYVMVLQYIFPALAQFANTTKNLFIFSFTISVKKLGWTFLMILVEAAVIAVGLFLFMPVLLIAMGLIAITNAFILNKVFKPFIEQLSETAAQEDAEVMETAEETQI